MTFNRPVPRPQIEFEEVSFLDKTIEKAVFDVFVGSAPSEYKPKAMFLAGDPGSNKDSVIDALRKENPGCVVVNLARLKEYHPRYDTLCKKSYYVANSQLEPYAKEIADVIVARAISERISIIFDGTFVGTYDDMNNSMITMKEAGYFNELSALSLNETYMLIRAGYNNEMSIKYKQQQILADPDTFRELYQEIPKNIDKAIKNNLIDSCKLYGRDIQNKETLHISNYSEKQFPEFQTDYQYHQNKDLTQGDVMVMNQIESKTFDMMTVREAPIEEIQSFQKLIAEAKGSISIANETMEQSSQLAAEPTMLYNTTGVLANQGDQIIDHIKTNNFAELLNTDGFKPDQQFIETVIGLDIPDTNKIAGLTILKVDNAAGLVHESKMKSQSNSISNHQPLSDLQRERSSDKGLQLKHE